jgi:ABC-type sugar transport system ATPase subunit
LSTEAQKITRIGQKIVLRLENVSKEYYGNGDSNNSNSENKFLSQHTVLSNLNLNVREGEFVTIVGPSISRTQL